MQDRVPLYPGRVILAPVSGQANTYDMARADQPTQEGTPLNKANLLSDQVASLIGLTSAAVPNDMFNVLATAGDLHVWRRTQPVGSGGYKLVNAGQQIITGTLQSADQSQTINYSDSITVTEESISLSGSVSSVDISYNSYENANVLKGKFFQNSSASDIIYYAPEDTVFNRASNPGPTYNVYATSLSTPEYVPPGTYTDYPVSVNPNAYQTGSDEQPAGYTLGEVVTDKNFVSVSANDGSANLKVANSITVLNDGTIDTSNFSDFQSISINYLNPEVDAKKIAGKFFVIYSLGGSAGYPATSELSLNTVYYAPPDVSLTYIPWSSSHPQTSVVINKFQQVTGYPAIPAGTTIEYVGQLGDRARVVTGSYVGTGTYGNGNPNTLEFDSRPAIVIVYVANSVDGVAIFYPFNLSPNIAFSSSNAWCRMSRNLAYDCDAKYASFSGTTLTWYNLLTSLGSGPDNQQNSNGVTYNYIAIL